MAAEDPRNIRVDIEAFGESRVYQVAEGSMYIGDVDSTVSTARRLAAMPVQQAVESILSMASSERAAVLAEMIPSAAAPRIAGLPTVDAVEVLTGIDERLALERLLAMSANIARRLVLAIAEPQRTNILGGLNFEQALRIVGEVDAENGKWSFDLDTLKEFSTCLPTQVIGKILDHIPPEAAAQVVDVDRPGGLITWCAMDSQARMSLVAYMPREWTELALHAFSEPGDALKQLCASYGTSVPTPGDIVGHMPISRLVDFMSESEMGPGVYCSLAPEVRVNLIAHMDVQGLANMFARLGDWLAECVWTMMMIDQSQPFRPPLACRFIAVALRVSGVDSDSVLNRIPREYAAALWDSIWSYDAAQEIGGLKGEEAYQRFSAVPDSYKSQVAWHLSGEVRAAMIDFLESKRWKNAMRERDLKTLSDEHRWHRFPDPLR
ncbi:hypothetical protein L0F81_21260 [Streptomyces tricolor]|uniref:Uncharacterized protein n=1 Tax=Streptomyces tricolor TaxID=68277 RepID=A0ABS9JJP5_9ACTN|nr:hypothetical protein [Streptomyces tricolor]MCG0065793.1 hypothetical protein [Streptomyces tricolor]